MRKIFVFGLVFLISMTCFADGPVIDIPIDQFFNQVIDMIKQFGGIPWTLKVASIIALIISSMKVSFVRVFWDKLGWIKPFVASILGLIAGILVLVNSGNVSFAGVIAYMFAGAGAVILHEMLDSIKGIPGIGPTYVSIIDFIGGLLKKPEPKALS